MHALETRTPPVHRRLSPLLLAGLCAGGCYTLPEVDLDGPRVLSSSLDEARVAISVSPALEFEFSEPLDPGSVHGGSVAMVPWTITGECERTPVCEVGLCVAGRCQDDPLSSTVRRAIDAGEFEGGAAVELSLSAGEAGEGARLEVRARRPLDAQRRHSVVFGEGLRAPSGAPLQGADGLAGAWVEVFSTARAGSGGPEPRLVSPRPGRGSVPTNLGRVELRFFPPLPPSIPLAPPDSGRAPILWLEAEDGGEGLALDAPELCPGWIPGTCLRLTPRTALRPGLRYRPAGGRVVDRLGRSAGYTGEARETWFESGVGPDLEAPEVEVSASARGRCVLLDLWLSEPVTALLSLDGDGAGDGDGSAVELEGGWASLGAALPLDPLDPLGGVPPAPGEPLGWSLELVDAAGNVTSTSGVVSASPSFAAGIPVGLAITEILANPLGPEPHAEFVELHLAADAPGPVSLEGLILSDLSLAEIASGGPSKARAEGDALPAVSLEPGAIVLIVGEGWQPGVGAEQGGDPAPPADTSLVVVDGSLAKGGLKNAGEPLTLWMEGESGPVEIASYGDWIDTSASAHGGRSVVAVPGSDGCDRPDRWRSHPLGRSTPGQLP